MDSHNFSSETNSIFVVQESSTEGNIIKHDFKVCDNAVNNLEEELKGGQNEGVVNSPTSLDKFNVGKDHENKNMNKNIEIFVKNEKDACKSNPVSKENSFDDSGEMNVTVTVHDNLICSIEDGKPNTPTVSKEFHSCDGIDMKNIRDDSYENEKKSNSGIISKKNLANENENLACHSEFTTESAQKIFKPISITSVKSLKITKPDKFIRNRLMGNPIFSDQDVSYQNFRKFETWKYFRRLSLQEMKCMFCKRKFSGQSGSFNLLRHLRLQHVNEMLFEGKLKDEFTAEGSSITSSVDLENVSYKVKKISKIWKYFSKSKLGKVKCKICFKIIPYRYSNSLLVRHLRLKHLHVYKCNISRTSKSKKKFYVQNNSTELDISSKKKLAENFDEEDVSTELSPNLDTSVEGEVTYPSSSNNFFNLNINKTKRKLSESWKHFTKLQSDKIKCNICDKTLKYMEGISSNLTRHLKVRHRDIYSKNNVQESMHSDDKPVAVSHKNEKLDINSMKPNEIHSNDYDDDKNVTKIRKYFSKFSSGKVKCNLCQVILTHTPGMTFNLKCHIILKHKIIFEKIVRAIYNEDGDNVKTGDEIEIDLKKIKLNWKYFTKMKSCKLKCNLCTEMPLFYCNTSDSLLHLHSKHNITLDSDEEQSVVSFIELSDRESYNDNTEEAADSTTKDLEDEMNPLESQVLKTDRTWKFFSKIYQDKAIEVKCNLCDDVFSYTRGITSNLTNHLNVVHKDEDLEIKDCNINTFEGNDTVSYQTEKSHPSKRSFTKKSRAWEYFTITEQSKAKCNICLNTLTFSPRSSSNLSRHLRRRHNDIYNLKIAQLTYHPTAENLIEFHCDSVEDEDDKSSLEVKSMFEFLMEDVKLKCCIKLESDNIKCNFCSETFVCQDVNSYMHVLQEHMQINHAEWQVVCVEDINSYKQSCSKQMDVSSNYNELEAIANEIQSYSISSEKILQENNENEFAKAPNENSQNDVYKNVWKYFTKLTSQNVRCNFCCALLLFRNNKKWNLYRHLRLKHKNKLDLDDPFFCEGKPEIKKLEFQESSSLPRKSPDNKVKKDSPQKKIVNSHTPRPLCKKDHSDNLCITDKEDKSKSVKSILTPRTGRTWSHFTKIEMGKATCNACHISIHYTGSGLDVLNEHLRDCNSDNYASTKKLKPEDPSSKVSVTLSQKSKLRNNINPTNSEINGGDESNNKDDEKCLLNQKISSSSDAVSSFKSDNDINSEEDKNDLDYVDNDSDEDSEKYGSTTVNKQENKENESKTNDSDVDSEKYERTIVNEQDKKENESVSKSSSVDENTVLKTRNELWPYFTNLGDGSAKCNLCLLRIPYKDTAFNLIRHLRRIHSFISVPNSTKEQLNTSSEDKREKSQLLAAINLTPNKVTENKKQICFTKLGKKTAKCNFCSKIIIHKNGNIRKLSNHLLLMHCSEILSNNELLLKHVKIFEKSDDLSVSAVDFRSASLYQLRSEKESVDHHDMPNKKRSVTWLYYKKLSNDSAQCSICNRALSYKGGSVFNLTRHLFIKHNIQLGRCPAMVKPKSSDKTAPKIFKFCKKKKSLLSFFTKINRFFVKCKLCYKHFIYKGVNVNRLVNHLWSSHIARLIDFNYGPSSSCLQMIESNIQKETSHSPMDNYIKDTAEVIYQSMSSKIKNNEKKRKISSTWKYYTRKSNESFKANCNICYKNFSFKNGNVSNLSRHLLRNHGIKVVKNYQNGKEGEKEAGSDQNSSDYSNLQGARLRDIFMKNLDGTVRKKSIFSLPFPDLVSEELEKSNMNLEKNNDNDVWKFMSINNGEVECNICEEKIVFKDDKVSESNLRGHLFFKHRIKRFSFVDSSSVGGDVSMIGSPSDKKVKNKINLDNCSMYKKNKRLKSSYSRMKCKFCNRYLILKENKMEKLFIHLSNHEKELTEDENITLKKILNSVNNCNDYDECKDDSNSKEILNSGLCEKFLRKHFKTISLFNNRCQLCRKFISSKIYCTHHIANDLSIKYGIKRSKSFRDKPFPTDAEIDDDFKFCRKKRFVHFSNGKNVNHFMNVNSCENKCGLCNSSLENKGYCSHSLNQWLSEKQLELSENPIKMKDELEIITDALSDGENKIIIITDDGAPIVNYDASNKNRNESDDVAYHVIDVDGENNDDIQVVIYNFDPEEGEKSIDQQANNSKIEEFKNPGGSSQTCNKELEEQVKVILQELNNANVFSNQVPRKSKNIVCNEEKLTVAGKSNEQQTVVLPEKEKEKEMVCEKKYLKRIFEGFDNKKKVEVQPIPVSETLSKDFTDKKLSAHSSKALLSKVELSESLESSQEIKDLSGKSIIEDKLSSDNQKVVDESSFKPTSVKIHNDLSKDVLKVEPSKESDFEAVKLTSENNSQSENTFYENGKRNNTNEAILTVEEPSVEFNSIDSIYHSEGLEINSGMFLQNLNGLHKINNNLIYFSNIDYTYNTAKCNICKSTLLFNSPVIYNLVAHLYLMHKDRITPTYGLLDITRDKNGKKILDLMNFNNDNNNCAAKLKPVSKPRRRSPVWKYFINNMDCRATCKICHFNFSFKGGAVNNLGRHLRLRHNVHISTRNVDGDSTNIDNFDDPDLSEFQNFPMLPKKRSYVKLRSKTWNYFSKEPNDWAKCILCKRYLSYRSSTINNLTRHLRTVHADIYSCLFMDKEFSGDDGTGNSEIINEEIFKNVLLETTASRSRDEVLQECSYSASDQSGTKRTSVVWNYFNELNRESGRCNFCSKIISCKGGGTSNLARHLRVKHGIWIVLTSTLTKKFEDQFPHDVESNGTDSLLNQNPDPWLTSNDKIITHEELHYLKNKKPESKKSKTWDYFVKETPDKVVCKICSKVLSYKCKAVHNLRRHLAIKHPNCLKKCEPVRLKLQIDNENESVLYEGQNDQLVTDKKYIDITNTSVVIVDEETPPPMRKPDRTTRPKKSLVWNYFEELEYGIARCNLCSKVLSFRGGGTNNLMRHLRSQHAITVEVQLGEDSGLTLTADVNDPNAANNDVGLLVVNNDDGKFILGN